MSLIKPSFHKDVKKSFNFTVDGTEVYLGSFKKTDEGVNIQVTVVRPDNAHTCYVHFTKEQSVQLAKLMELSMSNL